MFTTETRVAFEYDRGKRDERERMLPAAILPNSAETVASLYR